MSNRRVPMPAKTRQRKLAAPVAALPTVVPMPNPAMAKKASLQKQVLSWTVFAMGVWALWVNEYYGTLIICLWALWYYYYPRAAMFWSLLFIGQLIIGLLSGGRRGYYGYRGYRRYW